MKSVKQNPTEFKSSQILQGNRALGNPGGWLVTLAIHERTFIVFIIAWECRGFPPIASNDLI